MGTETMNEHLAHVLHACPTCSQLCGYLGKVTKDTTSQSMTGRTVIGMTIHKGRVTTLNLEMCGTNKTLAYVAIKAGPKKPKQAEKGNLPTFPDVTS
jgi:hypothetical protein